MNFEVTVLGISGAIPAHSRHPTSHYINYNGHGFLIDCGEGTIIQMQHLSIKFGKLDHIFITHLHGDHFFGLMGLITSFNLNYRETDLYIYGPEGIKEIVETHFKYTKTKLRFQVHFHVVDTESSAIVYEDHNLTVVNFPLKHRIPTTGYMIKEKKSARKILGEKIQEYNIPIHQIMQIKNGADFILSNGSVIANSELTIDSPPARSYAFCSDTLYNESILDYIHDVNLLYHEATFIHAHAERAAETGHSTTTQAATIAKKANAGKLIIGHFSARYENLGELLLECQSVFPKTVLGSEGRTYEVER